MKAYDKFGKRVFVYSWLFNDVVSTSEFIPILMNRSNDLESIRKEEAIVQIEVLFHIRVEELR
jgi:hypothetical protein